MRPSAHAHEHMRMRMRPRPRLPRPGICPSLSRAAHGGAGPAGPAPPLPRACTGAGTRPHSGWQPAPRAATATGQPGTPRNCRRRPVSVPCSLFVVRCSRARVRLTPAIRQLPHPPSACTPVALGRLAPRAVCPARVRAPHPPRDAAACAGRRLPDIPGRRRIRERRALDRGRRREGAATAQLPTPAHSPQRESGYRPVVPMPQGALRPERRRARPPAPALHPRRAGHRRTAELQA